MWASLSPLWTKKSRIASSSLQNHFLNKVKAATPIFWDISFLPFLMPLQLHRVCTYFRQKPGGHLLGEAQSRWDPAHWAVHKRYRFYCTSDGWSRCPVFLPSLCLLHRGMADSYRATCARTTWKRYCSVCDKILSIDKQKKIRVVFTSWNYTAALACKLAAYNPQFIVNHQARKTRR